MCSRAAQSSWSGSVGQTEHLASPRADGLLSSFAREFERILTELSFFRFERNRRIDTLTNLLCDICARKPQDAIRLSRILLTLSRALTDERFKNRQALIEHLLDHYESVLRNSLAVNRPIESSLIGLPSAFVQRIDAADRINTPAARDERLKLIFSVELLKAAADTLLCPDAPTTGSRLLALFFAAALVLAPEQSFSRTVIAVRSHSQSPAALYLQPDAFVRQYRLVRNELLDPAVAETLALPVDDKELLSALQNAGLIDNAITARVIDESALLVKRTLWSVTEIAFREVIALFSTTQLAALRRCTYDYLHVESFGSKKTPTVQTETSAENRPCAPSDKPYQGFSAADSDTAMSNGKIIPNGFCDTFHSHAVEPHRLGRLPLFDVLLGFVPAPGLAGWSRGVLAQALEAVQDTVARNRSQAGFFTVGLSKRHQTRLAFDKESTNTSFDIPDVTETNSQANDFPAETRTESKVDADYAESLKVVASLMAQYEASETLTDTRSAAATALKAQSTLATESTQPPVPTPAGLYVPETFLDVPPKLWLSPMESLGLAARCKRCPHDSIPMQTASAETEGNGEQAEKLHETVDNGHRFARGFTLEPGVLFVFFESTTTARSWLSDDTPAVDRTTSDGFRLTPSPLDRLSTLRSRTIKTFLLLDAMARLVAKLAVEGNEARGAAALQAYKTGFALTGPAADKEAEQAMKSLLAPDARRKLSRATFAELAHGYLMHEAKTSNRSEASEMPLTSGLEGILAAIRADQLTKSPKRLKRLRKQFNARPKSRSKTTAGDRPMNPNETTQQGHNA